MYLLIRRCTADAHYTECGNKEWWFRAWFGHSGAFIQKIVCQIKLEIDSTETGLHIFILLLVLFPWLFLFVYFNKETKEDYDQKVLIFFFFLPLHFLMIFKQFFAFFPFQVFWEQDSCYSFFSCGKLYNILDWYFYILKTFIKVFLKMKIHQKFN